MFYNKTEEDVLKELNTNKEGLSTEEANKRLAQYHFVYY